LSVSMIHFAILCCGTHKLLSVIICACSILKAHRGNEVARAHGQRSV
jgi:hypothetical protein